MGRQLGAGEHTGYTFQKTWVRGLATAREGLLRRGVLVVSGGVLTPPLQHRVSHVWASTWLYLPCQEAMNGPHLGGELLWVIGCRFLYRL
jgi:hypothetical protein